MINEEIQDGGAAETTPTGETGTADFRTPSEPGGHGRVRDAAGVRSIDSEGHGQTGSTDATPTGDDPHGTSDDGARARQARERDPEGPTYERGQGTADPASGGSTDPNNTLTHANSGDETESLQPE